MIAQGVAWLEAGKVHAQGITDVGQLGFPPAEDETFRGDVVGAFASVDAANGRAIDNHVVTLRAVGVDELDARRQLTHGLTLAGFRRRLRAGGWGRESDSVACKARSLWATLAVKSGLVE